MKVVDIRDAVVPIRSEIRNAVIDFSEMTVSAVAIVTDVIRNGEPLVGLGFNSNGRYAQQGILRERMIPRLLGSDPGELLDDERENFDPHRAWRVMMRNEKPGGHGERSVAVGVLDMALWDLVGKVEGKPLCRVFAERYGSGEPDPDVFVYAAGGYYYPGKGIDALQEELRSYRERGYSTVKMKVGGASLARDLRRIEAALEVVGEGEKLAVDANARFGPERALEYARALEPYDLLWYEEPVGPLAFDELARVSRATTTPLATGENLFSLPDARNLIRYGGLDPERDWIQVDPALGYGFVEYLRVLQMLRDEGWSWRRCIPHGGHQMALHVAAGMGLGGNESYPDVFQPFGGFADGEEVEDSRVRIPSAPGIGIEEKAGLHAVFRDLLDG